MKKKSLLIKLNEDKYALLMLAPTVILLFLFTYLPIYGILLAFQDYKLGQNVLDFFNANWVGLKHFYDFVNSIFFTRIFWNTLRLSLLNLAYGFWVPILFALLLNEIRHMWYKRITQTFVYLPYFISTVIVVAIMMNLTAQQGPINRSIMAFGGQSISFMNSKQHFDMLYVVSNIWQSYGYSSIIYLAAISGVDPTLYEAAIMDGANRFHRIVYITIPGILPTVTILLLLAIGGIISANTDKILLMYNSSTMAVADVIGTYVYRVGLANMRYSYTAAVGLFTNVINFVLIFSANMAARRFAGYSLW